MHCGCSKVFSATFCVVKHKISGRYSHSKKKTHLKRGCLTFKMAACMWKPLTLWAVCEQANLMKIPVCYGEVAILKNRVLSVVDVQRLFVDIANQFLGKKTQFVVKLTLIVHGMLILFSFSWFLCTCITFVWTTRSRPRKIPYYDWGCVHFQ